MREEHRLRVFENIVLRRIFGATGDRVRAGCIKVNIGEFHNLYPSLGIIRMIRLRKMR
jgi:hypothetical protein